jgi:hypothetical protein
VFCSVVLWWAALTSRHFTHSILTPS